MESLIGRLEEAISRLEDVESKLRSGGGASGIASSERDIKIGGSATLDPSVSAYDDLVNNSVNKFIDAANKIGGQVLDASRLLQDAFSFQRELISKFKTCKTPQVEDFSKMLQPLNEIITKANALTEGKRTPSFNHLKTVAESLPALVWVAYSGKGCGLSLPAGHVEETWQSAEFFNNKVLVEYKGKDSNHVEWAKSLKEIFVPGLRDYVRKYHPQGPVWNPSGAEACKVLSSAKAKPVAPGPCAPPPPPPPSFESTDASEKSKKGMNAVFQEISKGEAITSGLRKVSDDMKTKNRTDKSGVIPVGNVKEKSVTSGSSFSKTGPPRLELQMGRKWVVENQIGKKDLSIDDCEPRQSVYIYGCKDSILQIKGKVNNICIDKCTKTGVVFTDVVSTCEIVNCNSVEVQCQGVAPSISIDTTTGCQLYLSNSSLGASLTTSKSSEVNVMVPGATPDADMVEHPLPEQFIHTFRNGKFVTSPVSHSGN
eukprot:TRINITY_DN24922_c0_g1_i1.p1 TRINITY_DN24922_c0_g1~~TRINITY_DN24922_c0_g1_i1.p1  ORF type:complete len:484 (+),score=108.89 TRINITY_DN24922_c0_g1_i1:371-1822(+)